MSFPSRRSVIRRVLLALALLAAPAAVRADQAQPPGGETAAKRAPENGAGQAADAPPAGIEAAEPGRPRNGSAAWGDVKYLEGPDGRGIKIPAGARLDLFFEWLRSQHEPPPSELPAYSVTSIELDGRAEDDRATLTAVVKVQVNEKQGPVKVPLRMGEAVLLDVPAYEGPGRATPDHSDKAAGYQWWFTGAGEHRLTFPVSVPIRHQSPNRRLQLTLPPTGVSYLKLLVPLPELHVSTAEQLLSSDRNQPFLKKSSAGREGTLVEMRGLSARLDLLWRPLPNPRDTETALESETLMALTLSDQTVLLEAVQKVSAASALEGSFDRLKVQLPEGFNLLNVSGKEYRSHEVDAQNVATVRLTEPTAGPVRLRWTLQSRFSVQQRQLTVEGFAVEQARSETGYVAVGAFDGYHVARRDPAEDREPDEGVVRRANVRDLEPLSEMRNLLDLRTVTGAYRFQTQPFRLDLELTPIEAYFTAEPQIALHFSRQQVDLDASFQFSVYRGAVSEVEFHWPNWTREGWSIELVGAPGFIEPSPERDATTRDDGETPPASDDVIRIRLATRQNKPFRLRLKARRLIQADSEPFELSLPNVKASSRQPTLLAAVNAVNVETELTGKDGTALRLLSAQDRETLEVPEAWQNLRRKQYRVDSQAQVFSAAVTVHEQAVQTESTADVTVDLARNRLSVDQTIGYEVSWSDLSQVRLMVPLELMPQGPQRRVVFSMGGAELTAVPTGLVEVGARRQVRFTLDSPRLGAFEIRARYHWNLPEEVAAGGEADVTVPLIQSSDAPFSSSRLRIHDADTVAAVPAGEGWRPQLTLDDSPLWVAAESRPEIPLSLKPMTTPPAQDFSISRALVRTAFPLDGNPQSRAQYRVEGLVASLVVVVPPSIVVDDVWWNRRKLRPEDVTPLPQAEGQYRLEVSDELQQTGSLLTIDFRTRMQTTFDASNAHRIEAPQFPEHVWVAQTVWEIILPESQYLFTDPSGFSPQFRWRRQGVFWFRTPNAEYADLDRWIAADGGPEPLPILSHGFSSYAFSHFGSAQPLEFRSMNQSLIVLVGAGLALAAGFVLVVVPVTRHVLSLLTVACTLAVVRMWYAAPIELLLQPALIGLSVGIAASVIDGRRRRRREAAIFTISTPSDFISPPSTIDPAGSDAGSEEPTAVRSSPKILPEAMSASDSGTRR